MPRRPVRLCDFQQWYKTRHSQKKMASGTWVTSSVCLHPLTNLVTRRFEKLQALLPRGSSDPIPKVIVRQLGSFLLSSRIANSLLLQLAPTTSFTVLVDDMGFGIQRAA